MLPPCKNTVETITIDHFVEVNKMIQIIDISALEQLVGADKMVKKTKYC